MEMDRSRGCLLPRLLLLLHGTPACSTTCLAARFGRRLRVPVYGRVQQRCLQQRAQRRLVGTQRAQRMLAPQPKRPLSACTGGEARADT